MASEIQSNPLADTSFWSKIVEQRQEERVDFRTTGSVFPLGDSGTDPISAPVKIWTVDVSTTGALLRSFSPLDPECQRVLVELVMPQLRDSLIEGKVTHAKKEIAKYVNGKKRESYLYGIQFTQLVQRKTIPLELLDAPLVPVGSQQLPQNSNHSIPVAETVDRLTQDVESRLPLLSAIGLIVVYAALVFVF